MPSTDPAVRLADLAIIKASADLEVQLSTRQGGAPVIQILRIFRDRAAESLAALAFVDPEDAKAIRVLQNEVKRYDEIVGAMREIIIRGKQIDYEMTEEERDEMLDILLSQPDGERRAAELGLISPMEDVSP